MGGIPVNSNAKLPTSPWPTSGYAEPREAQATIAIFDQFIPSPRGGSTHGAQVEGVLRRSGFGDRDVQNFTSGTGFNDSGIALLRAAGQPDKFGAALDHHVQSMQTDTYDVTRTNLRLILDDPASRIKTVNQSQGVSQASLSQELLDMCHSPGFEPALRRHLGLSPEATEAELAQAVLARVAKASQVPEVDEARKRYLQTSAEAEKHGLSHVVASGNEGDFANRLEGLGVKSPAGFYRNILSTPHNTTVGASDHGLKPATFTCPEGAELSANGVDVPTLESQVSSGTSFAAPQVAAATARLRALNPRLTPRQVEDLLRQTATPLRGHEGRLGAGELDIAKAARG